MLTGREGTHWLAVPQSLRSLQRPEAHVEGAALSPAVRLEGDRTAGCPGHGSDPHLPTVLTGCVTSKKTTHPKHTSLASWCYKKPSKGVETTPWQSTAVNDYQAVYTGHCADKTVLFPLFGCKLKVLFFRKQDAAREAREQGFL